MEKYDGVTEQDFHEHQLFKHVGEKRKLRRFWEMSPVNRKRVEKTISCMAFKKGSWDMYTRNLWLSLHGCEYRQGPKVDVLFNIF